MNFPPPPDPPNPFPPDCTPNSVIPLVISPSPSLCGAPEHPDYRPSESQPFSRKGSPPTNPIPSSKESILPPSRPPTPINSSNHSPRPVRQVVRALRPCSTSEKRKRMRINSNPISVLAIIVRRMVHRVSGVVQEGVGNRSIASHCIGPSNCC